MAQATKKFYGKSGLRTRTRLMATAVSACFAASSYALPTDPTVVNGSASFNQIGNTLNVTNSNGAIINWNTFSIGANETTRFIQASSSSSVLNRVISNNPSVIMGTLTSNGNVWLINGSGILIGQSARIDVAGFVASTLNITNENFLAAIRLGLTTDSKKIQFDATPGAGSVVNQGSITTPSGGTVYLVAPNVSNEGIITTPQGETILAAGQTVTLLDTGTPGVSVEITGAEGNATNLGEIVAEAGRIGIAGVIVRNSGTLNASSVVNEGGRIFLKASQDAYVDGSGRIVTTGTKGGTGEVLGNRVAVMDNASIDASGASGGGTVLIGGDFQGKNSEVKNADITYVGAGVTVKADATDNGNGGKVIVWANDTTRAYGKFSAKGGPNGGNGGLIETSGHRYLDVLGIQATTVALKGLAGTWLLDPSSVNIVNTGGDSFNGTVSGGIFSSATGASTLTWGTISSNLNGGNVYITTDGSNGSDLGDINIIDSGSHFSSSSVYGLGLFAHNNIVASGVTMNLAGGLDMYAGWDGTFLSAGAPPTPVVTAGTVGTHSITITDSNIQAGTLGLYAGKDISLIANTSQTFVGSVGMQTVKAVNGTLKLQAANSGSNRSVVLASYGGQNISAHDITLNGGNGAGVFNNAAGIINLANANQNITIYGGAITLTAGSGDGSGPYGGSQNFAQIRHSAVNYGSYGQNIDFYGGGSLVLYGGSAGTSNSARVSVIDNNDNSYGSQWIGSSTGNNPIIAIYGGTGGGADDQSNEATIDISENNTAGVQTITAGSLYIQARSALYGGAGLSASTQYIHVDGDLTMIGGSSANFESGNGAPGTAAYIGRETDAYVNLFVGGNMTVNGGTGVGGKVLIGSLKGHGYVDAFVDGDITINANTGGVAIGSLSTTYGADVTFGTYGGIAINDSSTGTVLIGSAGGEYTTVELAAEGNITLGSAGGAGVKVGNGSGNGYGYVVMKAGMYSWDGNYSSDSGGDITLNGSTHINSGGISMYAGSGYFSGANGNITLNAGSSVTATGTVGIYADGNVTLNGSITTPNSLYAYSGLQNAYNYTSGYQGYGNGYGMGDKYSNSQFGGNLTIGGHITASHVELVANRGWDTGSNGDISQTAGSVVDITAVTSLYVHAAGNVGWNGTTNFVGSGGTVQIYSGYDYPDDSYVAGKYVSIGTINDAGGSVSINATGAILDGNANGTLNITADNISLYSTYGGAAGSLAISMDTLASNSISASVSSLAANGGISVRNHGAQPSSYISLHDTSVNGGGVFFSNTGDLNTYYTSYGEYGGGDITVHTDGNMIVDGGSFGIGQTGQKIVLEANGTMDVQSSPYFFDGRSPYDAVPDMALKAGGAMTVTGSLGGYDYYTGYSYLGSLTLQAASLNVNGGYLFANELSTTTSGNTSIIGGKLKATNNLSIVSVAGNVGITDGYAYAGNSATVFAGGALTLQDGAEIFAIGPGILPAGGNKKLSVSIAAQSVSLDDSFIGGGFYLDPNVNSGNVDILVSGGDIKLNNGSGIIAGNDVFLHLTGSTAKVVLNEASDMAPSRIVSDYSTAILGDTQTTHIEFLTRASGGIVIDGIETTTTAYSGSGFFTYDTAASIGNGLEISYGTTSNIAAQTIDQFFSNLTKTTSSDTTSDDDKKKKGDDTSNNEGKDENGQKQSNVGQCT